MIQISLASLHFKEYEASPTADGNYDFTIIVRRMEWSNLVEFFAFDTDVYGSLSFAIAITIFVMVYFLKQTLDTAGWNVVVPRPDLKLLAYFMANGLPVMAGWVYSIAPPMTLVMVVYLLFDKSNLGIYLFDRYTGNSNVYGELTSNVIQKYRSGRIGLVLLIIGLYVVFRGVNLLIPSSEKTVSPETRRLRSRVLFNYMMFCGLMLGVVTFSRTDTFKGFPQFAIVLKQVINFFISAYIQKNIPAISHNLSPKVVADMVIKTMALGSVGYLNYVSTNLTLVVSTIAGVIMTPLIDSVMVSNKDFIEDISRRFKRLIGAFYTTVTGAELNFAASSNDSDNEPYDAGEVKSMLDALQHKSRNSILILSQLLTLPYTVFVMMFSTMIGIPDDFGGRGEWIGREDFARRRDTF